MTRSGPDAPERAPGVRSNETVASDGPRFGETWVYDSIVGALPGVDLSSRTAIAIKVVAFEAGVLAVAAAYGLWAAAIAGTVAVAVAGVGSALMLAYSQRIRSLDAPQSYRRLLFGSNVEVVLGVLAFVSLVTHLFVYDPRTASDPLLAALLDDEPPVLAASLLLLVCWDGVYRIGTSWWAAVAAVWRAYAFEFDHDRARAFARADALNLAFAAVQLAFVPFLLDRPVLLVVLGHVLAVGAATALSVTLTLRGADGNRSTAN